MKNIQDFTWHKGIRAEVRRSARTEAHPFLHAFKVIVVNWQTWFPYLTVIVLMLKNNLGFFAILLLLIIYNILFVLPLLILCFSKEKKAKIHMTSIIDHKSSHIFSIIWMLLGIIVVIDGILSFARVGFL